MKGKIQSICDTCVAPSCIHPVICHNLDTSHKPMTDLYRAIDSHPEVKKSFIGSGIRYDMLVPEYNKQADPKELEDYTEEVITNHVSGRLKVAPEHTSDPVLRLMRKPSFSYFHQFKKSFDRINIKKKLNLQLIPYFISNHPACEVEDMANLAAETKDMGFKLEQVQGFTPTPMTVATVIYYSCYHPYTLKKVYVPKSKKEKDEQHRFFFWWKPENRQWIQKTLNQAGRPELADTLLEKKESPRDQKRSRKPTSKKRAGSSSRNGKKRGNRRGKRGG